MKKYLAIFVGLMLVSSCIKVEDVTLNPKLSGCGLERNSFQLTGYRPDKFSFYYSSNAGYGNYYEMFFSDTMGNALYLYFPGKPSGSATYNLSSTYYGLGSTQCYLYYQNGANYSGFSGSVSTTVSGSEISASFCNVELDDGYNTVRASGYFVGS